jgi:hypothetical protein
MTAPDPPSTDSRASLRWAIYSLIIVTAAGAMVGRIFAVRSQKGGTPFLSANDRSRWCTIRAIVDEGTQAIDDVIVREIRDGREIRDPEWHTIDKVRHKDKEGRWRYYSSKPPLLPTLLAGPYWLIKAVTGATLAERPFYVGRMILILTNVIPLMIAFGLLALIMERFGTSDFGRVFVVATAAYGTLLTTFAVTLNNHLPAVVSVTIALYAALRIWCSGDRAWWLFLLAGLGGTFAAANELPALALLACLGVALVWRCWLRTLIFFLPGVAVVAVPFFAINYAVHDSFRPPYAHWGDGRELASLDQSVSGRLDAGAFPEELRKRLAEKGVELPEEVVIEARQAKPGRPDTRRWVLIDPVADERYSIVQEGAQTRVHAWDNWYDFPGSYWEGGNLRGVDAGEPSRSWYLFHMLVGHHGLFSLTPVWILSLIGIVVLVANPKRDLQAFGIMVAVISLVVIAFYVTRPEIQRNYGGVSCGLRWLLWLAPLWLVAMTPVVDWIGGGERDRSLWWGLALILLLLSAVTAAYAAQNPWVDPWIYQYWQYLEWPVNSRDLLLPG